MAVVVEDEEHTPSLDEDKEEVKKERKEDVVKDL